MEQAPLVAFKLFTSYYLSHKQTLYKLFFLLDCHNASADVSSGLLWKHNDFLLLNNDFYLCFAARFISPISWGEIILQLDNCTLICNLQMQSEIRYKALYVSVTLYWA